MGGKRNGQPVLRRISGEPEGEVPEGWQMIRRVGAANKEMVARKKIWKGPALPRPNANERAMIQASLDTVPAEACGALLLRDGMVHMVEYRNEAHTRLFQFRIPDNDVIALHRLNHERPGSILAIWHSHPFGHPAPSAQDCLVHPLYAPIMAIVLPKQLEVRYFAREEENDSAVQAFLRP